VSAAASADDGATSGAPAYEQFASSIRKAILTGELKAGDRLPPEATLAKDAGLSRSTVREALRVLQESGFLERPSPKILVVRAHTDMPAFRAVSHALRRRTVTFGALNESLMLLEPELARLAARRRDADDLRVLRDLLDAQHVNSGNYREWCRLDEAFHVSIAEASANAPLVLARTTLGQFVIATVAQFVDNERATEVSMEFHERIYEQIAEGDDELAALMARRHIEDFRAAWEHAGLGYDRDISELTDISALLEAAAPSLERRQAP
jgi:GntR family transcriptional repressor for pyruvate dehydrogenase complex